MKNKIWYLLLFVFTLSLGIVSCSSDDDSDSASGGSSFKIDGTSYNLSGSSQEISVIHLDNAGTDLRSTTVSVIGVNGTTKTGTVSFTLVYKKSLGVSGTYDIVNITDGDDEDVFDTAESKGRACSGWTSALQMAVISPISIESANNPSGKVTVKDNKDGTYTVQFSGKFNKYKDDLTTVEKTFTVDMDVKGKIVENTGG